MNTPQNFPITDIGYKQLQENLDQLKKEFEKMPAEIAHARERGDLKENAEYHAARERQGMLNAQILKVSADIQNSKVIDPKTLPADVITFGKLVEATEQTTKEKIKVKIVGPAESSFTPDSISITSALARGLLAKKKGELVTISVPAGDKIYKIDNISL